MSNCSIKKQQENSHFVLLLIVVRVLVVSCVLLVVGHKSPRYRARPNPPLWWRRRGSVSAAAD